MALKEPERDSSSPNDKRYLPLLSTIWTLLGSFTRVEVFSLPGENKGKGVVFPRQEGENKWIFEETGSWEGEKSIPYYNSFRFTRHLNFLSLEHLRFGKQHPVFLFDLVPQTETICISRAPHICGEDLYYGTLELQKQGILLMFDLKAAKTEERVSFTYSSS